MTCTTCNGTRVVTRTHYVESIPAGVEEAPCPECGVQNGRLDALSGDPVTCRTCGAWNQRGRDCDVCGC